MTVKSIYTTDYGDFADLRLLKIKAKFTGICPVLNLADCLTFHEQTPSCRTCYRKRREMLDATYEKNGDEGNRILISAMRPRRAPVTLRPQNILLIATLRKHFQINLGLVVYFGAEVPRNCF